LRATLERLVDFDLINDGPTRLTVGAVNVLTGNSVIFDSAERRIGPEHIMASGSLPPGFPPVVIDGQPHWDGGLMTNTPLQFVLDEKQSEDLLVFQIDLFNAQGSLPNNLIAVDERQKDIHYSSRTRLNTDMIARSHENKKALRALNERLPKSLAKDPGVEPFRRLAQQYATTVVQLIYRKKPYEGVSKDFEFSRQTMIDHWASGLADVERCAKKKVLPRTRHSGLVVIDPGLADR
jgi:NTE family protein